MTEQDPQEQIKDLLDRNKRQEAVIKEIWVRNAMLEKQINYLRPRAEKLQMQLDQIEAEASYIGQAERIFK